MRMLGRPNGPESRATRRSIDVAARYGFRRVEHVHIRVGDPSSTATVTGIAHRYPRSIRVPLSAASWFVAAGTPFTLERTVPPRERADR